MKNKNLSRLTLTRVTPPPPPLIIRGAGNSGRRFQRGPHRGPQRAPRADAVYDKEGVAVVPLSPSASSIASTAARASTFSLERKRPRVCKK